MQITRLFLLLALLTSSAVFVSINFEVCIADADPETVTIYFIDVGQGDSIFIDTPGLDVLVDGGPRTAGNTVVNFLQDLNITEINLMVATHMDADHIGGLITVLNSPLQVDEILINNQTGTTVTYNDFITLANTHNVTTAQRGDTYALTLNANFTVLNPVQPLEFNEQNLNSVAMRLQVGESSFLFMGDAEDVTEESILQSGLDVGGDVLKVGHHGSRTATTNAFLTEVSPSIAIISAGVDNPYGHPHQETLDKLLADQITIYGTYQSGTLAITANLTSIQVLNNPIPIPELSVSILIASLTIILSIVIICKRKNQPIWN